MENIVKNLIKFVESEPNLNSPPDYLDLRNGKLSFKPCFVNTIYPSHQLPSLAMDDDAPNISLASSSVPIKFNFK